MVEQAYLLLIKSYCLHQIITIIIHSNYLPVYDWLKPPA